MTAKHKDDAGDTNPELTVNDENEALDLDARPGDWDGVQKPPAHVPDHDNEGDGQVTDPVDTKVPAHTPSTLTKSGEKRVQGRPANGTVCKDCGTISKSNPIGSTCPSCGSKNVQPSRIEAKADGSGYRVAPAKIAGT